MHVGIGCHGAGHQRQSCEVALRRRRIHSAARPDALRFPRAHRPRKRGGTYFTHGQLTSAAHRPGEQPRRSAAASRSFPHLQLWKEVIYRSYLARVVSRSPSARSPHREYGGSRICGNRCDL